MKKLYKLKSWFSLADAAERLSAGLGESVAVDDILQLVVEGHLPLSWYARRIPARKVILYDPLLYGGRNEPAYDDPISMGNNKWMPIEDVDAIVYLDGPYRLELKYCVALMDWIHAHLARTSGEPLNLEDLIVSDSDRTLWQIMEYDPGSNYKTSDGKVKKIEPYYYPSRKLPDKAELVIQRDDIEFFENTLKEQSKSDSPQLSQRTETSYLNMIGVLLGVISEGIPSPEPNCDRIGPASGFESEAKLITALAHHYQGFDGLSKRNLEKKFPTAKRSINTP